VFPLVMAGNGALKRVSARIWSSSLPLLSAVRRVTCKVRINMPISTHRPLRREEVERNRHFKNDIDLALIFSYVKRIAHFVDDGLEKMWAEESE